MPLLIFSILLITGNLRRFYDRLIKRVDGGDKNYGRKSPPIKKKIIYYQINLEYFFEFFKQACQQ